MAMLCYFLCCAIFFSLMKWQCDQNAEKMCFSNLETKIRWIDKIEENHS